ncbi:hypothetical protein HD806DRAFT_506295 [Xylariaceae sp. AK1471]|nr:hypothetical protein HD806DRAFT_506295 [Xylariaceae sp. AK1471]
MISVRHPTITAAIRRRRSPTLLHPRIAFSAPTTTRRPLPSLSPVNNNTNRTSPFRSFNSSAPRKMSSSSAAAATAAPSPNPSSELEPEPEPSKLPPLSGSEFRQYNRLAEHMDAFHNHFRTTWNVLYTAASSGRRPQGTSIRSFINTGLQLVSHLETHHSIEEAYVFPRLATRMPEFRTGKERNLPDTKDDKGKKKAAELLQQHVEIHKGMEGLEDYLRKCLSGEADLEMGVLKAQLDTWGTVLWTHLDQEVRTLGAENMRRYWSLDEMRKLQM